MVKITVTEFDGYTEELWEPDDPPADNGASAKGNGHATPADDAPGEAAWPVMASAAFHGLAGRVVATLLPHTESDPVALLLQYLVSFGNAIGRQPFYRVEAAEHYPILFALLVGQTAKSRKGTSAQHVRRVMQIADDIWAANNVVSGISSGEGIIHTIRDPIYTVKKGQEELADPGVTDKRLMIDEREFSSVLDNIKRETNVASRVIRDAWDSPETLRTLTKKTPSCATRPHISIAGHITLEELRQKLDQTSIANGFGNRFLYACVKRSKLLPHGGSDLDENEIGLLGAATLEALTAARTRAQITIAPEANQVWEETYPQLTAEVPGLVGFVTSRADPQTVRLALIYALLDQAAQIEKIHLEAALAVWAYCEASARFIFSDYTGDPEADTILRGLRIAGAAGLSRWEINNGLFGRNTPAAKIAAALLRLLTAGKVRREMRSPAGGGPGRPVETWFAK